MKQFIVTLRIDVPEVAGGSEPDSYRVARMAEDAIDANTDLFVVSIEDTRKVEDGRAV